ncbi:MAG: T9SS type A sorting domain-containing protein [Bacteroidetes bacterium]|nr:T9SS type A sorting domain-containing protein [Bacteroidota bacterium]
MKKPILVVLSFLLFSISLQAQNQKSYINNKDLIKKTFETKGEVFFKFLCASKSDVNKITEIISIDNVKDIVIGYEVRAFANEKEFNKFLEFGIEFELLPLPCESIKEPLKMSDNAKSVSAWDSYPTYDAYITMMNNFAAAYPNICKIVNIGTTVQGRQLLFAVISDSVSSRKSKPRFMYTSSIHGDEVTGYILMLRFIDTLLSSYSANNRLTNLVKNCEIWICPLANPDGTYKGGNSTVNGAVRYNANNIDLNRNYPDPAAGPHPDGNAYQPETIAFMNIANTYNFTMGANFHGGEEVYNYPWDTWARLHPDDDWSIKVGKRYVDTVHANSSGYMTAILGYPNYPGLVDGYAWYRITGGRQDWMNYYKGCREVTIEISTTKLLPASQLPSRWNYNFRSFINHVGESLYGIRGIISDSVTNLPLKGKVSVLGKDIPDSTWIFSDSTCGDYHRLIAPGTYTLTFSAANHYSKTISSIRAQYDSTTILDVILRPNAVNITNENNTAYSFELKQNFPNPFNPSTTIKYFIPTKNFVTLKVYDSKGTEVSRIINEYKDSGEYEIQMNNGNLSSGVYYYKLTAGDFSETKKMILLK